MPKTRHRIHIARTQYKFSCAHMTVFPDGSKERLHGHNYFIAATLELADVSFERLIPFQLIKDELGRLCQEWKEHTLVPLDNPFFELLRDDGDEYEFKLCGKRYVLPREDVLPLPIDNIAVEPLANHFAEIFLARIRPHVGDNLLGLDIQISEVPGQGASIHLDLAG
jgi:6-pyruvoyltetrahydropterin/6-carboxytetrahydropterin synthase